MTEQHAGAFTDDELRALYEKYAPVVYHRCYRILHNEEDAQDALQETFAKVLQNANTFRRQSSPLTWMYRISTNHSLDVIRNRSGREAELDQRRDELQGEHGTLRVGKALRDHEILRGLLEEVDEQTRQVVVYTFFEDCTRKQTAALVGIAVPTVRKHLQDFVVHARTRLGLVAALVLTLLAGV